MEMRLEIPENGDCGGAALLLISPFGIPCAAPFSLFVFIFYYPGWPEHRACLMLQAHSPPGRAVLLWWTRIRMPFLTTLQALLEIQPLSGFSVPWVLVLNNWRKQVFQLMWPLGKQSLARGYANLVLSSTNNSSLVSFLPVSLVASSAWGYRQAGFKQA